ncbi:MAG: TetR/AcrR family transcriptional regulator [Candidatus Thorarchaeota archaeon]
MTPDETTRRRILESAYELFVKKGYRGSSMRDIATKAGIKAGSIYNHFGGKEQIFEVVFIEKHPMFRILAILEEVHGNNAEELLTNAVNRLNKELKSEPNLLNLFFVELVEMDGKHIPEAIRTNFPSDSNFMKQIFQMKNEIRDIREPVLVRALIGTILANIMFNWFIGDTKTRRWGSSAELTDVLLRGILKEK